MRSLTINEKKWINLIVKKYPVNRNLDSSFSVQFEEFSERFRFEFSSVLKYVFI